MFKGKKVILGISGGIASYKLTDIVSWLKQNNAEIKVIMTKNACEFITPLTMQTLSGAEVAVDLFKLGMENNVAHINAVKNGDLMLIAPATGNILAKARCGIADEILSASILACTCPVTFAPAMNVHMYEKDSTQENIRVLQERGYDFIMPESGYLACGVKGNGRLADLDTIKKYITNALLKENDFQDKNIVITAGPTRENIDPVRYISNRSSGKMGYALANAFKNRGANVTLISGPTNLVPPSGVNFIQVTDGISMEKACLSHFDNADAFIMSAAVGDYRLEEPAKEKMKKSEDINEIFLKLVKNPDILKELGEKKDKQVLVGFAAETNNLEEYAIKKLEEKNLDFIVANNVAMEGAGFDVDTNICTIISKSREKLETGKLSKKEISEIICDKVKELL